MQSNGPLRPFVAFGAGWSSPVARQAHNLKVVGSNPTPATKHLVESIAYQRRRGVGGYGTLRKLPEELQRMVLEM